MKTWRVRVTKKVELVTYCEVEANEAWAAEQDAYERASYNLPEEGHKSRQWDFTGWEEIDDTEVEDN